MKDHSLHSLYLLILFLYSRIVFSLFCFLFFYYVGLDSSQKITYLEPDLSMSSKNYPLQCSSDIDFPGKNSST